MPKRIRMRKSGIRTAPKSQEKYFIENAKKLYDNPLLILPECTNEEGNKSFRKIRRKLEKIHRFRDEPSILEKISKKKGLESALAGTLLLAQSKKAPYLAVASYPSGNVLFAQRGGASKEHLIAMQHVDDPVYRLFGLREIVTKKKLYVYSWDTGYICTGRVPQPPKEFLDFLSRRLGLTKKGDVYACPHLPSEHVIKGTYMDCFYLRLTWKSAHGMFAVCEECAKTSKNTLFFLSKYFLEPRLSADFDIDVVAQVFSGDKTENRRETKYCSEYLSGKISDYELIQKNVKHQEDALQHGSKRLFVLNGVSYGSNTQKFIDALQPNHYERLGLEYILARVDEPVVVSDASCHVILDKYWKTYGKDVLHSLLSNTLLEESFFSLDETPSNMIKLAVEYTQRQQILSELPRFQSLPPLAQFIDHIVRTYKTFGENKTLNELKKRPDTTKGKSVTYAFLLALGKADDTKWQYDPVEIEYGEYLKEYAEKLLSASSAEYTTAFQNLLTASGSSETLPAST